MSKQLLDSLLNDLQTSGEGALNEQLAKLTPEQLDALFEEAQVYKSLGPAGNDKVVVASVSILRESYVKKLLTTSLISFLFQMKDELTVDEEALENPPNKEDFMEVVHDYTLPEGFNTETFFNHEVVKTFRAKFTDLKVESTKEMETYLTEDELLEATVKANEQLKQLMHKERKLDAMKYNDAIQAAIKEQSDKERAVVNKFLENVFKYNKDKHLQEGVNKVEDDPERTDIEELKGTDVVYDNVPPNDTFCRFDQYFAINYEKMREATKNIYNLKPDLEHAMIVYDVVENQEAANTFVNKYGSSSKFDIITFDLNKWALLGQFKENRERIDYYNKHNGIIKAILEQQQADNMLGEDLMKKRVKSTKVKAEKVFGKDSPQFSEYKKLMDIGGKDGTVEELDEEKVKVSREVIVDAETGEELKLDEDGVPTNAIEVPITTINARTGEVKQSRFFSKAEK